jgi:hypothetical protein
VSIERNLRRRLALHGAANRGCEEVDLRLHLFARMLFTRAMHRWFATWYGMAVVAWMILQAPHAGAAEPITVHVRSGRSFTAMADARTDATWLWLRFERGGTVVLRPIAWSRVLGGSIGERELSVEELHALAGDHAVQQSSAIGPQVAHLRPGAVEADGPPGADRAANDVRETPRPRVAALAVDVQAGHWDNNAAIDGLRLTVVPLDRDGRSVSVSGSVEVSLIGEWRRHWVSPPELGHWTKRLTAADCGPAGAVIRLPLQRARPEFDTDLSPHALVYVELTVPGQGTFHAPVATIRLRPYNAVADRRQQRELPRSLLRERAGRESATD